MIIKSYEVIKKKLDNYNLYLFYGENIGLKKDLIKLIINIKEKKIGKHKSFEFEEEEILKNPSNFYNLIFSGSLFDQKKIIKINRASDKLFNLINPTHAFFGEKDAQQLRVIKKMVTDLNFPIEVVPCSIVREDSGLALSSRNKYLSEESKKSAATIYKALCHGASLLKKGEQNSNKIRKTITKKILNEPLMKIDYISIVDYASFNKVDGKITGKVLLCAAIYCDGVRLIDNICYPPPSDY